MRETIKPLIKYYEAIWNQSKITNSGQIEAVNHILYMEVKRMITFSELERGLKLLRVLGAFLEDSIHFPAYVMHGSQMPVTLVLVDPKFSSGLTQRFTHINK